MRVGPGAFTDSSAALPDTLAGVGILFIEVRISSLYQREPFWHTGYISDIAAAVICGCGTNGYTYALDHAIRAPEAILQELNRGLAGTAAEC